MAAIPSSSSACAGGGRHGRPRPGRGAITTPSSGDGLPRPQRARAGADRAERGAERRRTLRRTQLAAGVLAALLVMALVATWWAWRESARAERNLDVAREAVDERSRRLDRPGERSAPTCREMVAFRRDLMRKAERFYTSSSARSPTARPCSTDVAEAHKRLGHIHRIMGDPATAEHHYRHAIGEFERLATDRPAEPAVPAISRETHTTGSERPCGRLPALQATPKSPTTTPSRCSRQLYERAAGERRCPADLARTRYNRGILLCGCACSRATQASWRGTEFRRAIELLEPIASSGANRTATQDLAPCAEQPRNVARNRSPASRGCPTPLRARHAVVRELSRRPTRPIASTRWSSPNRQEPWPICCAVAVNTARHCARTSARLRRCSRWHIRLRRSPSMQADGYTLKGRILEAGNPAAAVEAYTQAYRMFEVSSGANTSATHRSSNGASWTCWSTWPRSSGHARRCRMRERCCSRRRVLPQDGREIALSGTRRKYRVSTATRPRSGSRSPSPTAVRLSSRIANCSVSCKSEPPIHSLPQHHPNHTTGGSMKTVR